MTAVIDVAGVAAVTKPVTLVELVVLEEMCDVGGGLATADGAITGAVPGDTKNKHKYLKMTINKIRKNA